MRTKDTIIAFNKPEEITVAITDTITELAREGARQMLASAHGRWERLRFSGDRSDRSR